MLNGIWMSLLLLGIITAAAKGEIEAVTQAAFSSAQGAVEICLELIGTMSLWLGLLKIAEQAGMIELIARIIRPLTSWLFPSIPPGHPALGAIILNLSANVLGLGNAATPFGMKAMQEMQSLNKGSDTASDAMCTFLALNTSCITLVPATILGVRAACGSSQPAEIIGPTIFATVCATLVAVSSDRVFRYFYYRSQKRGKA